MTQDKSFLGTQPVGKLLVKLAVPTVISQIVNMLYNIIDRVYIGHIPGEGSLALTGMGICMPIILIISAFAALVASGGAPRASICMGKGDNESAEKILGGCFAMQIIISAILTIVLFIWDKPLLMAFGASENTIDFAVDYMNIYALGTIFVQLTLGMNAFITAQGFANIGMITVSIGAVANIILDPIFIFGFGTGKKTFLRLKKSNFFGAPKLILPCVALGLSAFIMQASESVISVCFNSSLLKYGGDVAVGAMTILTSVMQFAMLPLQGIAQGAQPITSYNYGAGNAKRVKKTFKLLLVVCLCYSFLLWGCVMLFPRIFAGMFTTDASLMEFTVHAMRVYFAVMFIFGIQIACQMTFVSIGNAVCSIIVAIMRKFVLLIPLIYILPNFISDKTTAVYTAEPAADIIAVTFTAILFAIQFNKSLKKLEKGN